MATRAEHAKRKGRSGHWITATRRLAIHLRDGFTCVYCERDLRFVGAREMTLDHLKPRCAGGTHESGNLVTACTTCNYARQNILWWEFAPGPEAKKRITTLRRRVLNLALARDLLRD